MLTTNWSQCCPPSWSMRCIVLKSGLENVGIYTFHMKFFGKWLNQPHKDSVNLSLCFSKVSWHGGKGQCVHMTDLQKWGEYKNSNLWCSIIQYSHTTDTQKSFSHAFIASTYPAQVQTSRILSKTRIYTYYNFIFNIAPVNCWTDYELSYALCASHLMLSYTVSVPEAATICADILDNLVSCARCLRKFWGECSKLVPILFSVSSVRTQHFKLGNFIL
jgi:hypothetical protein